MTFTAPYKRCTLCPRNCGVDRTVHAKGSVRGVCGESDQLRVSYVGPHFGEEPPITGTNGSGTVFFSGCSLKCSFCQNHQISHEGLGNVIGLEELTERAEEMVNQHGVHNINLVTPDHFFPHVFKLVGRLRHRGVHRPIVFNLSGYQSKESLISAEPFVDIYLPDFKYADPSLAGVLSKCRDYPLVALEAITEMVRQKGFLDGLDSPENEPATRGVLVRHLALPGKVSNSIDALTSLFVEFGSGLPLSLMSQYHPVLEHKDPDLNRRVSQREFEEVLSHAESLGFENLFVQFPEEGPQHRERLAFLPDFRNPRPFSR